MNHTPRQQADALYAERPLQERFISLHNTAACIDSLDVEQAPILIIRAEPDNPLDKDLELTITGAEFLADFKALILARLQKMRSEATVAMQQAGIPEGCTTSQLEVAPGISVTIVHRDGPPIAHSEVEVMLD